MSSLAAINTTQKNRIIEHKLHDCSCPMLSEMFRGNKGLTILGYESPFSTTPRIEKNYVPRENLIRPLLAYIIGRQNGFHDEAMQLAGVPGAGKTSVIRYLASLFNWPVYSVTGHADLEMSAVVGRVSLTSKNGLSETPFQLGALPLWAKAEHAVFLFNEFDRCAPEVTVGLNSVLDGGMVEIPDEDIYIQPHPSNLFIMTANSSGLGDSTGMTPTSQVIDGSTNDRYSTMLVPYPKKDEELSILRKRLSLKGKQLLPDEIMEFSINFGELVRNAVYADTDRLPVAFTTRTLIRFWRNYLTMKTPIGDSTRFEMALDLAYCNKFCTFETKSQNPARNAVLEMAQNVGLSDALDTLDR